MEKEKPPKNKIRKLDVFIIILLIVVGGVCIYTLYNIDSIEDDCRDKLREQLEAAGIFQEYDPNSQAESWAVPIDYGDDINEN